MLEQIRFLHGSISLNNFGRFLKSSIIIWLLSIEPWGSHFIIPKNTEMIYPFIFAGLGAITFAHSFVINKMFNLK